MARRKDNVQISHTRDSKPRKKGVSPRFTHGTRVAFNVTCEACGKDDTLPFVPHNAEQILCGECAEERFGENWDKGRSEKPTEFEFDCAACGESSVVPFVPEDPSAPILCRLCEQGIQKPVRGRVDGGEIIDSKAGVRKRKR